MFDHINEYENEERLKIISHFSLCKDGKDEKTAIKHQEKYCK